ncbi:MAG: hypothetical protein P4L59_22020 [Desulfosporosinus sp.]|nr:hypothetical protein [Desulfosporosinus sp.]
MWIKRSEGSLIPLLPINPSKHTPGGFMNGMLLDWGVWLNFSHYHGIQEEK